MPLSKDDLQSIMLLLNDGLAPITQEITLMKTEMLTMKFDMVTKEELKGLATKEDLSSLATKNELKNLATKEELKGLATKEDLNSLATKNELKNLATKEELKDLATKDDVDSVFNELMKTEIWTGRIENRLNDLKNKVDTLLLQSDNTSLLLKLSNQHSDEICNIKSRVDVLEMKLA